MNPAVCPHVCQLIWQIWDFWKFSTLWEEDAKHAWKWKDVFGRKIYKKNIFYKYRDVREMSNMLHNWISIRIFVYKIYIYYFFY